MSHKSDFVNDVVKAARRSLSGAQDEATSLTKGYPTAKHSLLNPTLRFPPHLCFHPHNRTPSCPAPNLAAGAPSSRTAAQTLELSGRPGLWIYGQLTAPLRVAHIPTGTTARTSVAQHGADLSAADQGTF